MEPFHTLSHPSSLPFPGAKLTDAAAAGRIKDVALMADTGKAATRVGTFPIVTEVALLAFIHIW